MQKKTRSDLESVKPVLEEFYRNGLTDLLTTEHREMADNLCLKTNLTHKQVKNWLSNKRKSLVGLTGRKKSKVGLRQKSGRDLFLQECMKGNPVQLAPGTDTARVSRNSAEILSSSASRWLAIKNTPEGQEYVQRAKLIPPTDVNTLSDDNRSSFLSHMYKKLTNLLSQMESAGMETIVYGYNVKDGSSHCFGTDKGMQFRSKRPDVFANFMAFVTDGAAVECKVKETRKKVIDLLDMRYCELTGIKKCSFDALRSGTLVLEGLPEGMKFINPYTASKHKLSIVLAHHDKIKFRRIVSISPSIVANDDLDSDGVGAHNPSVLALNGLPGVPPKFVSAAPSVFEAVIVDSAVDDDNPASSTAELENQVVLPSIKKCAKEKRNALVKPRKRTASPLASLENDECKMSRRSNRLTDKKDNVYAVEAIRRARVRRGKTEYFIKWRDYAEEKNSWEPSCNILDDKLVALWESQN